MSDLYSSSVAKFGKSVVKDESKLQVACGENHSAALSLDGRVYTWGLGKTGQLGHDSTETLENPARV